MNSITKPHPDSQLFRTLRRIHIALMSLLAVSLSFSLDGLLITSLLIILLALSAIPLAIVSRVSNDRWRLIALLLFILVYLIHVFGLIHTENSDQGGFELEKKLSLIIFPLICFFTPRMANSEKRFVMSGFVIGCLASLLFCFGYAVTKFSQSHDASVFFYHSFSEVVGMHAAYLSMYLCLSIAWLLFGYKSVLLTGNWLHRFAILFLLMILIGGVILLAARAQILILFLITLVWVVSVFYDKWGWWKASLTATVTAIGFFGLVLVFPVNRERFKQAINYNNEYSISGRWGENQIRVLIWSCAFECIEKHPWLGSGTGDGESEMQECYQDHKYGSLTYFPNTTFNAHNQFLEIAIQLGWLGLLIFLSSILYAGWCAFRESNTQYLLFLFIFMLSCMTESQLETQSGIVFFAMFNSLHFFNSDHK